MLRFLLLRHSQDSTVAVTPSVGRSCPVTREVTTSPGHQGLSQSLNSKTVSLLLVIFRGLVPPGIGLQGDAGVGEGDVPVPDLPVLVFTDSFHHPRAYLCGDPLVGNIPFWSFVFKLLIILGEIFFLGASEQLLDPNSTILLDNSAVTMRIIVNFSELKADLNPASFISSLTSPTGISNHLRISQRPV